VTLVNSRKPSLYEQDYLCWVEKTVEQLKSRDFDHLDLDNLIEEVESLGRSEKHAVSSYLMRLCEHLLKVKYWETERAHCLREWNVEITNFRIQIQAELESSPSLKTFLQSRFAKDYKNGRKLFLKASELDPESIPEQPCFTLEQALEEDWLP